jgi:hypothetical protein
MKGVRYLATSSPGRMTRMGRLLPVGKHTFSSILALADFLNRDIGDVWHC